jgi:hypothetical protein
MPERIWDAASIEELSTRLRDRAEVARTESTMTARCDAAHFIEAADAIEALFIRADLVDDLVKALEEARERVEHWADVASRADRTRYDTSDDLAMIRTALTRIKGDVT